jgi:hypothetical protein
MVGGVRGHFMTPYQKLMKQLNQDHSSADAVFKILHQHGFGELDRGAHSTVYGKDSESYVVKVNRTYDPGAFKFYSMIAKKKSQYIPLIHKLIAYVDDTGDFLFIAVMERLHDFTWQQANHQGRGFVKWLTTKPYASIGNIKMDENMARKWESQNKRTAQIVQSVIDTTAKYTVVDLHEGNIMVRLPQGDVVLIDPVCS